MIACHQRGMGFENLITDPADMLMISVDAGRRMNLFCHTTRHEEWH